MILGLINKQAISCVHHTFSFELIDEEKADFLRAVRSRNIESERPAANDGKHLACDKGSPRTVLSSRKEATWVHGFLLLSNPLLIL